MEKSFCHNCGQPIQKPTDKETIKEQCPERLPPQLRLMMILLPIIAILFISLLENDGIYNPLGFINE